MQKLIFCVMLLCLSCSLEGGSNMNFETDIIQTRNASLDLFFIGHGTLMLKYRDIVIHIDPFSRLTDYGNLPKADLILITHHHHDHLDMTAVKEILTSSTKIVCPALVAGEFKAPVILSNGMEKIIDDIGIRAVPAYNLIHMRNAGEPYHKKGEGNGYVLTIDSLVLYIAGDTENIPEMKELKNIDIAFLPVNLPYTMTPEMAADAVSIIKPKIFYPYHFGNTDMKKVEELVKNIPGVEFRLRKMQ